MIIQMNVMAAIARNGLALDASRCRVWMIFSSERSSS